MVCTLSKRLDLGQGMDPGESKVTEIVSDPTADGGKRSINYLAKCTDPNCTTCGDVQVDIHEDGTQTLTCGDCKTKKLDFDPNDPGDPGNLPPPGGG